MKIRMIINILLIFLFQTNITFADNPYIREGSIGVKKENNETVKKGLVEYRPIKNWIGEKFIFLPKPEDLQQYNYSGSIKDVRCEKNPPPPGKYDHLFKSNPCEHNRPSYKELAGRIGTIIDVKFDNKQAFPYQIVMKMDDNGDIYTDHGEEYIDGIAPIADIDYARKELVGKTLWFKQGSYQTYDEDTGEYSKRIKIKKYLPVKVIDAVAGHHYDSPVRLVLQAKSGEEWYQDINLSGTNTSLQTRDWFKLDYYFLMDDPRKKYKWSQKVWSAIEKGNVFVGMTAEQARMAWGEPKRINTTTTGRSIHEQWVYNNNIYLYFDKGTLRSIQN